MKRKVAIFVCLVCFATLVSCVTNRDVRLFQERSELPGYETAPYVDYKLKPTDKVRIKVYSTVPEVVSLYNMSSKSSSTTSGAEYQIYDDGTIDLPFADSVRIAGLTLKEAERKVEEALQNVSSDIYAHVTLSNNVFYVIGRSGNKAVSIPKERLNIYQALALANFSSANFSSGYGNVKNVKIIRLQDDGQPEVREFDLRTLSVIESPYYYVYPNDIIYIESTRGSFFRIQSFASFVGTISSSLSFLLLMMEYVVF